MASKNIVKDLLARISEGEVDTVQLKGNLQSILNSDLSRVHPSDIEALSTKVFGLGLVDEYEALICTKSHEENRLILSCFESMKKGQYFPTCNPYSEESDMTKLQMGVERGLYSQAELDNSLSEMRKSKMFKRLREIHEGTYNLDHTPFASREDRRNRHSLNDYGFHLFIGREVFDNGQEVFVTLDNGSKSYIPLCAALEELCEAVKKGRKVPLTRSPGRFETDPDDPLSLASRTYEPFDGKQMATLKKRFLDNTEMQKFDNPFNYQP